MDSNANVTPQRSWWTHTRQDLESFHNEAERLLQRHNSILEPKAFHAIHKMLQSAGEPQLIQAILQSDKENGYHRPPTLGNFLLVRPVFFESLLELIDWLIEEKKRLTTETGKEVGIIEEALQGCRASGTPKCMISPEKLASKFQA